MSVPVEVTRLDYYGRELEIWAEVGTMARLKATASGMRHQWDTVRWRVDSRLASRVLEEVDHLASVFQR